MLLDLVEHDRRTPGGLLRRANRLVLVVKRRLAGHITLQLARQVDARLGRQAVERGRLVELVVRVLIESGANRVEEIVARVRDSLPDSLVGVQIQALLVDPALRRIALVVEGKLAFVADHLRHRQLTVHQSGCRRHQLENGARRIAGADGVVDQRVAGIEQDIGGRLAAHNERIGIIWRIAGQRQHAPFHIDHDDCALFRERNRVGVKVACRALKLVLVLIQPGGAVEQHLLRIADVVDVVFQRLLRHALQVGVDRQLDVVAVGRLRRGERPVDRAVAVDFHHALAHALRRAGGKPVLHGLFHAVQTDQVRQRIALVLVVCVIGVVVLNLSDVADDVAGHRAVGVHALAAHGDGDALQRQRLRLDLDDRFPTDVGGDGDRLGEECVVLHRLPDAEHLNLLLRRQAVRHPVFLAQRFKELLLLDILHIEVAAPHALSGGLLGRGVVVVVPDKDPHARHFVLLERKGRVHLAAVALHDLDDVDDRIGVHLVGGQALARLVRRRGDKVRIAVKLHVVNLLVVGQRHGIDVHDRAARALARDDLGLLALGLCQVVLIIDHLKIEQLRHQHAKERRDHQRDKPIAIQICFHEIRNPRYSLALRFLYRQILHSNPCSLGAGAAASA